MPCLLRARSPPPTALPPKHTCRRGRQAAGHGGRAWGLVTRGDWAGGCASGCPGARLRRLQRTATELPASSPAVFNPYQGLSTLAGTSWELLPLHGAPHLNVPYPLNTALQWLDWKRREGESVLHYTKRLCSEGHSVPDAFLTVASAQIGGWVGGVRWPGLACVRTLPPTALPSHPPPCLPKDGSLYTS